MREVAPGVYEGGNPGTGVDASRTISSRQGKQALLSVNKYHSTLAALEALDEPMRTPALIDWNGPQWDRKHPAIEAMGALAGLTSAEIDALFDLAATL